jgi:hypothetical protein
MLIRKVITFFFEGTLLGREHYLEIFIFLGRKCGNFPNLTEF